MYNSDGYILLDFSKINFSKTNQTINGLYDRIVSVVGSNKFVIVINANGRTPLPSTVSFVNNVYVLDSVIYAFEISSNDNLRITKKTTVDEIIDDSHTGLKTTYSSSKIVSMITPLSFIDLTDTLTAGETSIEFEDDSITTNSKIFPMTSIYGVNPTAITTINGKCTLTFDMQENDVSVCIRVY